MNQRVSRDSPDLELSQDGGAVEGEIIKKAADAPEEEQRRQNGESDMHSDEERCHVDRVPADPRHRFVIVGSGDSEHAGINGAALARASCTFRSAKILLEKRTRQPKLLLL